MATLQYCNTAILQYCNTATRHHGNDDTLAATRRQPPSPSMAKTHRATTTTEPLEAMRGTQYTCSMPRRRLPTRRQGKHHSSTAAAEYTLRLPQTLPPYASSQLAQTSPQTHSQRAMAVLLLTPQTVNDHNASNQGHSAHATSPTTSRHQDITTYCCSSGSNMVEIAPDTKHEIVIRCCCSGWYTVAIESHTTAAQKRQRDEIN